MTKPPSEIRTDRSTGKGVAAWTDMRATAGRALVLHPVRPHLPGAATEIRDPEARVAEATGLALAIGLDVVHAQSVKVTRPRPATLFGSGTVEAMGQIVDAQEVGVVIVDAAVSPVQQRNLEKAWKAKVIDRTGLILEIFGARARTHEGSLQVELAALSYQRSRLVRSWTHLERQRGGFGFLGGPGESQLEIDRRLIDERIVKLKRELEQVKRTRGLHRTARQDMGIVEQILGLERRGRRHAFGLEQPHGVVIALVRAPCRNRLVQPVAVGPAPLGGGIFRRQRPVRAAQGTHQPLPFGIASHRDRDPLIRAGAAIDVVRRHRRIAVAMPPGRAAVHRVIHHLVADHRIDDLAGGTVDILAPPCLLAEPQGDHGGKDRRRPGPRIAAGIGHGVGMIWCGCHGAVS